MAQGQGVFGYLQSFTIQLRNEKEELLENITCRIYDPVTGKEEIYESNKYGEVTFTESYERLFVDDYYIYDISKMGSDLPRDPLRNSILIHIDDAGFPDHYYEQLWWRFFRVVWKWCILLPVFLFIFFDIVLIFFYVLADIFV